MKLSNAVPRAGSGIPLLGHLWPLLRDPLGFLAGLPATDGAVEIGVGPARLVLVRDLDLTRQVLCDDRTFDKGGPLYRRIREVIGGGLVNCPHGTHRRQRRLVQPAFRTTCLANYAQAMTDRAGAMSTSWHDGQTVDVRTEAMTLTSEVLTATMFSDTLPAPLRGRLLDDITTIGDGIYRRMLMPPPLDRLPTPGNRAYSRARTRLRAAIEEIVQERRAGASSQTDLLSVMLAARDSEPDREGANGQGAWGLTDSEINDTILSFFLAGTETTATTLAWALHLLAEHPSIEERLHHEVDEVLGGRAATQADLPGLRLTGNVILETLRLYPPVWFVTRTVTDDTVLGGYHLPKGTSVVCSPFLIHHTEEIHAAQATFDPDRWAPRPVGAPAAPRHDAFLPFGGGARKCIGDAFALMEATLALATVTAHWRLEHVEGPPVRPARGAVLRPQELRMRVLTRSPTAPTPTPSAPAATCVPEPASEAAPTLGRPVGRILTEAQVLTEPVHRAAVDRLPSALRLVAGYHAGWWDAEGRPSPRRGKAVRPALVLACARAVAGAKTTAPTVATAAVTAAVAVELAHDFTLLHDDLMDGDRHRRHRPSAWTVFGAPRATLAGDALVVLALDTLAATPLAPVLTRALLDVCTGQAADMAFEGPAEATVEQCLAMAEGKTGALLGAACHLGALAAGAGAQEADRYRQFGHHLGVAFQLADDLLGIWGEPGVMGKSADADLTARKLTLPVVAALASGTAAGDRLAEVYRQREPLDRHALAGIRELIEAAGGRSWAQEEAGRRAVLALGCLADAGAPTGPDTDLVQLAGLLTRRDR